MVGDRDRAIGFQGGWRGFNLTADSQASLEIDANGCQTWGDLKHRYGCYLQPMALLKLADYEPDFASVLGDRNLINYNLYSQATGEKIGTVKDILVDETDGSFRYLVIDIGFWIFGKQVLLPIGLARLDFQQQRVEAKGLSKEQAEELPEFTEALRVDYDYEEQLRANYRPSAAAAGFDPLGNPAPPIAPFAPMAVGTFAPLTTPDPAEAAPEPQMHQTYRYEDDPSLYGINDLEHPELRRAAERLQQRRRSRIQP